MDADRPYVLDTGAGEIVELPAAALYDVLRPFFAKQAEASAVPTA